MYQNVINASFFSVFVVSLLLTKIWNLQHQAQCLRLLCLRRCVCKQWRLFSHRFTEPVTHDLAGKTFNCDLFLDKDGYSLHNNSTI